MPIKELLGDKTVILATHFKSRCGDCPEITELAEEQLLNRQRMTKVH